MNLKHQLEREYHESETFQRDESSLIVSVYSSGLFDEMNNYFLGALGYIQGLHVLDFGCGTGEFTRQLCVQGATVTGIDISQTRLVQANRHIAASGDPAQTAFVATAAERLPFISDSYDAVFGKQILHHLEWDIAILEISRVLRPGGKAVFLEPLAHNPLLELYRRLTPQLRSPTEKALSLSDLQVIGCRFKNWTHREFCFLAVLPVLVEALLAKRSRPRGLVKWLQRIDRRLADALPFIGRYYWSTVITVEK